MNSTFQAISGYYADDESELSGEMPEELTRAFVAPRFLAVWGIAPAIGRGFTPMEERFGGPQAALISDRLWRLRFGGNPNISGKTLRFGKTSVPVVGVMPASFLFPLRGVDVWSPSPADAPFAQRRDLTWFNVVGRMKPGVTVARARADLSAVQADLGREFPRPDAELSVLVNPLQEATVKGVRSSLWILFASVTLLSLIACANVAVLLLARASARRSEIAVRFSLGASRASIAAHLLAEVSILALSGAAMGLLLAAAASGALRSLAASLPRSGEIILDFRIVLYTLGCGMIATLLCGMLPVLRGTSLTDAARGSRTVVSSGNRIQLGLAGFQIALTVILLVGAALLIRSLQQLGRVSPGFDPRNVLTFRMSASWGETADFKASQRRVDRLLNGLRALPGVEEAAAANHLPGVPSEYQVELKMEGGRAESEPKLAAQARAVTPSYFATLRIPLLAGELCRDDLNVSSMMVNRSFADAYFAASSPVGHRLSQPGNLYVPSSRISGIVGDAREMGIDRAPVPTIYWCVSPFQPGTHFLVRTRSESQAMRESIRKSLHTMEPSRAVYDVAPLAGQISDAYSANRLRTILLAFFASSAMLLACVGLYGTLSYTVNRRRREVGLRLALGAIPGGIVRRFLFQGLAVAVLGCIGGVLLAAVFTRALAGVLYGVSTTDPRVFAAVVAMVLAVSLLASLFPALRAARVEPVRVLREE